MTTHPDPTIGGPVGGTAAGTAGVQDESSSPSLGELLGDITRDVSTLMRQEVALAKAEVIKIWPAVNDIKAAAWIDNQVEPRLVRIDERPHPVGVGAGVLA